MDHQRSAIPPPAAGVIHGDSSGFILRRKPRYVADFRHFMQRAAPAKEARQDAGRQGYIVKTAM
jgi:hypothetical protein